MGESSQKTTKVGFARFAGAGLLQIIAYILGLFALAAAFFASALMLNSPIVMMVLGLLFAAGTIALGSYMSGKLFKLEKPKLYMIIQTGILTMALGGLVVCFILQPLVPKADQFVAASVKGAEFWDLPTGSKIVVRKYSAQTSETKRPIIILHGGPGAYSVSFEPMVDVYSKLTANGHDVYFYDQIGGGLSARLNDISEYSLDRHIDDLKAIRDRIGSDQVILIGSSWGATLAANYLAKYPNDVSRIIFSGPGPIYRPDWTEIADGNLDEKMNKEQKKRFDSTIEKPRLFTALILADINPEAAARFAPEQEMGSFFDKIANEHYLPLTMCDPTKVKATSNGYGFWSSRMTGKTLINRTDDPKPVLKKTNLPVLVLRGTCDYKKEAVAKQYASVFPNSKFIAVEGTGHMIYGENPDEYLRLVRDFLQ
ncbi:alpha/beta hydrolase [Parasphingorhabdus sp.]|uniref:alpha/beta hydrolase n=1 Tax=Parasphingorhabdus sp. TaxID=2709688 RepID=UPI00326521FE